MDKTTKERNERINENIKNIEEDINIEQLSTDKDERIIKFFEFILNMIREKDFEIQINIYRCTYPIYQIGYGNPHGYNWSYQDIAFKKNVVALGDKLYNSIDDLLDDLRKVIGAIFAKIKKD